MTSPYKYRLKALLMEWAYENESTERQATMLLADHVGVHYTTMCTFKNIRVVDSKTISRSMLVAIASFFGCTVEYLVSPEGWQEGVTP